MGYCSVASKCIENRERLPSLGKTRDPNTLAAGAWELKVFGKNGVTVKNTLYTPSSPPLTLQSGDLLQLGGKAFFFLLEKGTRARQKELK